MIRCDLTLKMQRSVKAVNSQDQGLGDEENTLNCDSQNATSAYLVQPKGVGWSFQPGCYATQVTFKPKGNSVYIETKDKSTELPPFLPVRVRDPSGLSRLSNVNALVSPGHHRKASSGSFEAQRTSSIVKFPPEDFPHQNQRPAMPSMKNRISGGPRVIDFDDDVGPSTSGFDATSSTRMVRRPPTVICYICGREYGTASISIHEKQCLIKWKRENDEQPKNRRRSEPVQPQLVEGNENGLHASGKYDLDATNEARVQSYYGNLVPCEKCGRTFKPDSLNIHEKNCRGLW